MRDLFKVKLYTMEERDLRERESEKIIFNPITLTLFFWVEISWPWADDPNDVQHLSVSQL